MKNKIWISLLLLSLSLHASAQDFSKGKEAYHNGNYAEAIENLAPLAEKGNPDAQYYIGLMHSSGHGFPKSDEAAAKWYRLSGEQGNIFSLLNLDLIYSQDRAGTDKEKASWYLNIAEKNMSSENPGSLVISARHNIGMFYLYGKGVSINIEKAIKWLKSAASHNYSPSQYALALEYYKGENIEKNIKEATRLFNILSEIGDRRSQYLLGELYLNGEGVPQNHMMAAELIRKSAEQGFVLAIEKLGLMYAIGLGVEENFIISYILTSLSAARGSESSIEVRDSVFSILTREQANEAQKIASEWESGTPLPYPEDVSIWP